MEIGPGNLILTEELLKYFTNGTVVENNPLTKEIYNHLSDNVKQRLEINIGDFFEFNSKNKYDLVISCEVIEHICDDNDFINRIYNLINEGGQLIVSVPAHQKFWSKHDELVGHIRRYSKNELYEKFSQKNFENIRIISYGYPFVNILRHLRILFAVVFYKNRKEMSINERSVESGISPLAGVLWFLRFLLNKYTTYPLCIISSFFNNLDLSEGYILIAEKK